jgi:phage gpG-like protein
MPAAEIIELRDLPAALARLAAPPQDYSPFLKRIAVLLQAESKRAFAESRSPEGQAWAPLKRPRNRPRERRARKQAARQGRTAAADKVLVDTGLLMMSVTAAGPGGVVAIAPTSVTVGTTVPYAGYHQRGTRRMVARPFLGAGEAAINLIEQMAADFLVKELVRRPLGG